MLPQNNIHNRFKVIATGKAKNINVITTGTDINLTELAIENAYISADDDAEIRLNEVTNLTKDIAKRTNLVLNKKPINRTDNSQYQSSKKNQQSNPNIKYIDFKIKNNSLKRYNFIVVGPKKDGNYFSYGFSMLPQTKRNEKWTNGTKIYKKKKSGERELLVTITLNDENEVVNLF